MAEMQKYKGHHEVSKLNSLHTLAQEQNWVYIESPERKKQWPHTLILENVQQEWLFMLSAGFSLLLVYVYTLMDVISRGAV